jgi:lysophospholipase
MKKLLVSLLIVMAVVPLAAVDEARLHAAYETEIRPYVEANSTTGKLTVSDGTVLSYRALVKPDAHVVVVLVGGHTESYVKYSELLYDFREANISIYALDHRGQGFSTRMLPDPEKDHVSDYNSYIDDLDSFLREVVDPKEDETLLLVGQSFGAAVAAAYAERFPASVDGLIMSSPYVSIKASALAVAFVGMTTLFGGGEKYVPGGGPYVPVAFEDNKETHSKARHERKLQDYVDYPAIRLGFPTNRWIVEIEKLGREIRRNAKDIICPTLVFHAEIDEYVQRRTQNALSAGIQNSKTVLLEGAYHEILIETDSIRDLAFAEIREFVATNFF